MKNFFKWFGVIAFLVAIFIFAYSADNRQMYKQTAKPLTPADGTVKPEQNNNISLGGVHYVQIAGVKVKVELALTSEAKALGLGGRTGLAENTGMLFVFYQSGQYAFWMKDMKFPIDIIWIREDGEVVYVKKNLSPESYPASFRPEENVKYVLEVPAGFSDKNKLKLGDKAEFVK